MVKKLETSVILNLGGNLAQMAAKYGNSMAKMSNVGVSSFAKLSKGIQWSGNQIDRLANRYTGAISAVAGTVAVRNVANLQERLERLGIIADKSSDEMKKINDRIYQVSQMRNINVAPDQLTAAIEKMAAMTGDVDFAVANMENLGMAISATGAAGEDIGAMVGNMFQKFNIKSADEILQVLDIFANQANEGSFELKDLATQGERIMAAYATLGRSGAIANREMGALMQISRMGTGSAEQAATAFEAMVMTFSDPAKIKLLKSAGIAVKDNAGQMRAIPDILKDIIVKTKGDATQLNQVFDRFAFRGISTLAIEFQNAMKQGKSVDEAFSSFQKFYNVQASGQTIMRDSKRMADTFNASVVSLKTAVMQFSQTHLTAPIEKMAKALNSLDPVRVQKYFDYAVKGAAGLATIWAAGKALDYGGRAVSFFRNRKKGGALGGVGDGLMAGATPVYVVNMGAAGLGGGLADVAGLGGGKYGALLKKAGIVGAVAYGAYEVGGGIAALSSGQYEDAGEKLGGAIGMALGAFGGPFGMIIGNQVGKFAGGWLGRWVQDTKKETEAADKAREQRIKNFEKNKNQTVILKNENNFKVISDEKGVRVIDANPVQQTKIPLDTGYTRIY
ncbi:MAG: phage tail tape measure protein [Alphaproteobacteria bacterium]